MGVRRVPSSSAASAVQMASTRTATTAMFVDVPLAKRVNHLIEWSGSGILLDMASAALSLLSVVTYMVETYYTEDDPVFQNLRIVDQVCSVIFALEWTFWLWLARDRLGYILSWQSLVDLITVIPIFLSALISTRFPGFATFEAMVRIFRVVRVFRIFRLGKRLKSEVLSRLLTLVFTLVAVIVTAAGVFYEIETRFGDRYPDLTIMESIYWSVVTATTIGYGDFSPSITASQLTLLGMLLIAFTLLPYQTSMLVNALSETSVYQSAHYSHAIRGHHVVVTGHLTARSAGVIVEQVFHPDSGFADYNLVFLHPSPPTDAMRKLLKTSQHAHRLLYLQGSWASQQDLARTQVDSCDAVFILCNKAPESAKQEDLQTLMACLAIGQYIQRVEKARLKVGPKPLMQRLLDGIRQFALYFRKAKPSGIPRMCIQLLLPESKQQLHQLLALYSKHGLLAPPAPADPPLVAAESDHDAAATVITRREPVADPSKPHLHTDPGKAAAVADSSSGKQHSMSAAGCGGDSLAAAMGSAAAGASSRGWWQRFSRQVTCICVTELRFGLLAQSCMGCSGAITLVCNLIRSVDDGVLTQAEFEGLPEWAQEYLEGSSNELYEVTAFPACLHGQPVAQVAQYVLGRYRAVLVATAGTSSLGQQSQGGVSSQSKAAAAAAGSEPCNDAAGSQQQQQQQQGCSAGGRHQGSPLLLSALTLCEHVTANTVAYVIASDVRVVIDIMDSTADDYSAWQEQHQQQRQQRQHAGPELAKLTKHSMAYQPAVAGAVWRAKAAQHHQAGGGHAAAHAAEPHKPLVAAAAEAWKQLHLQHQKAPAALPSAADGSALSISQPSTLSAAEEQPAMPNAAQQQADPRVQLTAAAAGQGAAVLPAAPPAAQHSEPTSGTSSRRATAEPAAAGASAKRESAARLKGMSARSLLAAFGSGTAADAHEDAAAAAAHTRRRRLGTIQVTTRGAAELGGAGGGDADADDEAADGAAGSQAHTLPLATPSQRRRSAMELRMQQLYHTRDWSRSAAECIQAMACEEVHLQGHLLICGCNTPPAALACLLKPLRSTALPGQTSLQLRPIVVLDTTAPAGPDWEELSRLSDVYHVQGNPQSSEALIRACADTAATAVVLLPWSQPAAAADVDDLVAAGMVDAAVLSVVRRLRALNPSVQVLSELNQDQSLRFLDPLGSLLDGCAVDEAAAAAASPAFMSGAVLLPLTDILMCQAVNNRGIPHILASILTHWHRQPGAQAQGRAQLAGLVQEQHAATPAHELGMEPSPAAASPADSSSTCQQASLAAGLVGSASAQQRPLASTLGAAVLQQVPVQPEHYITFGELFAGLLQQGILCCSLYRQAACHGTSLSYVYTNPHKDTLLRATDRAFVLATTHTNGRL